MKHEQHHAQVYIMPIAVIQCVHIYRTASSQVNLRIDSHPPPVSSYSDRLILFDLYEQYILNFSLLVTIQ